MKLIAEIHKESRGTDCKGELTKMIVEGALEGEMDDHLGYGKHDPAGRDGGNSRNGHRSKTVLTGTGPVEISVPRDRESSFGPSGQRACGGRSCLQRAQGAVARGAHDGQSGRPVSA